MKWEEIGSWDWKEQIRAEGFKLLLRGGRNNIVFIVLYIFICSFCSSYYFISFDMEFFPFINRDANFSLVLLQFFLLVIFQFLYFFLILITLWLKIMRHLRILFMLYPPIENKFQPDILVHTRKKKKNSKLHPYYFFSWITSPILLIS